MDRDLVGLVVHPHRDRRDVDRAGTQPAQIDQEHRQPAAAVAGRRRRGAREQQHRVGVLEARRPALAAVHHVHVAAPHRRRLDARRVAAGDRLGHAERLQPHLAARDPRQPRALLRVVAPAQQRAHRVELRVRGARVAAGVVDLLDDHRRVAEPEAEPAVLGRDQRGEVARLARTRARTRRGTRACASSSRQYAAPPSRSQSARTSARSFSRSTLRERACRAGRGRACTP